VLLIDSTDPIVSDNRFVVLIAKVAGCLKTRDGGRHLTSKMHAERCSHPRIDSCTLIVYCMSRLMRAIALHRARFASAANEDQ